MGELILLTPTALAVVALWWLMINPTRDPTSFVGARSLLAKRIARIVFWCVFGPTAVLIAGFWADPVNRDEWGHVGWGFMIAALPLSMWTALSVYGLLRLAHQSTDAALLTPRAIRTYRMRFISGWGLCAYAALIFLASIVAWGVSSSHSGEANERLQVLPAESGGCNMNS